ncbi:hypothetical protein ACFL6U_22920 [Planctomycetota bacterium]
MKKTLLLLAMLAWISPANAVYTETMNPNGLAINLMTDYGLVDDNAEANQSDVFQAAIDAMAAVGGGRLIVPQGTYRLAGVRLRSNIHLLIAEGTVIKPYWPAGTKTVVFLMDAERPANKKKITKEQEQLYIENVSIRGLGGRFMIDYSDRECVSGEGIRGVLCKMVKNFLIENMEVKDNFTTYCGITLTPTGSTAEDIETWDVSRATDGTIRDCHIFNASPGYGLVQLHGARSIYLEDIYAKGGVALRLETGAVGPQTAVYDITAQNVTCEDGRCAVMFGPHSAVNGVAQVDGVVTIGCAYAVTMGKGGVKEAQLKIDPEATDGTFAKGSTVRNIHAVFGKTAQIKTHAMLEIPEEYYDDLNLRWFNKFFEGPSIGAVKDTTEGHYHISIGNVTMEGFKYYADKPILTEADFRPGKWGKELQKWKTARAISDEEKNPQ